MHIADILIDVYAAESAVLRARRRGRRRARGVAARRRRARVRQRRGAAHRRVGAPGARRDGRRRHAAHDAGGAAAAVEDRRRSTPSRCGGGSPTKRSRAEAIRLRRRRAGGMTGSRIARHAGFCLPPSCVADRCLLSGGAAAASRPTIRRTTSAKIAAERAAKDAAFAARRRSDPDRTGTPQFLPLAYFPIDPDYNVPAALKPVDDTTISRCRPRPARQRKMRRVGTLEFTLKGQPLKLTAFVEVGARILAHCSCRSAI